MIKALHRLLGRASAFDHESAQRHELADNLLWLKRNQDALSKALEMADAGSHEPNVFTRLLVDEFFAGDSRQWADFMCFITGRAVLDIGSGPLTPLAFWPWARVRYVIDPLADAYSGAAFAVTGRSWFDQMRVYSVQAEDHIRALASAIDGAIVCRNALDHARDPYAILSNIASYAAPECRLLLWTDLHHLGQRDNLHTDITDDRDGFRRHVGQLGFEILGETTPRMGRNTIEFGCLAMKRRVSP